jgi:hypothetical protein
MGQRIESSNFGIKNYKYLHKYTLSKPYNFNFNKQKYKHHQAIHWLFHKATEYTKDHTCQKIDVALGRSNLPNDRLSSKQNFEHQSRDGIEIYPSGSPVDGRLVCPPKGNPHLGTRGRVSRRIKGGERVLNCRRDFERTTWLNYMKEIYKITYPLSADNVKITEVCNFFLLLLLYSPNPA